MNILFVATDYPKKGKPTTGFPAYLYRVSKALAGMGHRPMIVACDRLDSHRYEDGIEVWRVSVVYHETGNETVKAALDALTASWVINKKIREIMKDTSVDIIQFTSLRASSLFYYEKTPSVFRLSSYTKTYFSTYQTFSRSKVAVMSFLERMASKRCNIVFAPCRVTADAFGKDIHRRTYVIETPFVNDVEQYDFSIADGRLGDKKYVLFFGTLYIEKGILVIADILEDFLGRNPEYYFVFAGRVTVIGGKSVDKILKERAGQYADRVVILGELLHERLYPVIQRADFVVLPSIMDNFPNACIEAMYFSKVVIGTDGASFEQLITHERNGLLCGIGDSEDLLEKMQMAVSLETEKREEMGRLAQERIRQLEPRYVVRKLLRLYEHVIRQSDKG